MDAYSMGKAGSAMIGGLIAVGLIAIAAAFGAGILVGWLML